MDKERKEQEDTCAWSALREHYASKGSSMSMPAMFKADPDRFKKFSVQLEDVLLDPMKHENAEWRRFRMVNTAYGHSLRAYADKALDELEKVTIANIATSNDDGIDDDMEI